MFGLTFEKLFLVALVAGIVIGPTRLPAYAQRLTETIRSFRDFVDATRTRAVAETGMAPADWDALDPRRYDPRRIVRQAFDDPTTSLPVATTQPPAAYPPEVHDEAARVRPGQRFLVSGSAAHPRRLDLHALPADDPRRIAAGPPPEVTAATA